MLVYFFITKINSELFRDGWMDFPEIYTRKLRVYLRKFRVCLRWFRVYLRNKENFTYENELSGLSYNLKFSSNQKQSFKMKIDLRIFDFSDSMLACIQSYLSQVYRNERREN